MRKNPDHSPIEDYALIGDCETAALVARNGSIDWLCWPRFDSEACFASLLGDENHGYWRIAPTAGESRCSRQYRGHTLVLETVFETDTGTAAVIDFMPIRTDHMDFSNIVRLVVGRRGEVPMRMDLVIRFEYGRIVPWVCRTDEQRLRALAGPHSVVLDTPISHRGEDFSTIAEFVVREGDRIPFVLTYEPSHLPLPPVIDPEQALRATEDFWEEWIARRRYSGPWDEAVTRSLITIKALTYRPTGGVVAAPTTSLPERIGGERNWDYRYCWLRDATLSLLTLISAGYKAEAEAWGDWLLRAIAGSAEQVQPLYGVSGEYRLHEMVLPWLPGYHDSAPVRLGNAAYRQLQIDVFGAVMDALYHARRAELDLHEGGWPLQCELMRHLEDIWRKPDAGIWEVRSEPKHFVHSKVLAWAAFDRAIAAAEEFGLEGPIGRWRELCKVMHAEICERGFNAERNTFVQHYGSTALDAANLLIPLVGFLPHDDPRVVGTVTAVERELLSDGLVRRYDVRETDDGVQGEEGCFLACSFWLTDNLLLQGRRREAQALFERLLSLRNDVGLLAEQYDPYGRRLVGNFPQAFSHFTMLDTALNFAGQEGSTRGGMVRGRPRGRIK